MMTPPLPPAADPKLAQSRGRTGAPSHALQVLFSFLTWEETSQALVRCGQVFLLSVLHAQNTSKETHPYQAQITHFHVAFYPADFRHLPEPPCTLFSVNA